MSAVIPAITAALPYIKAVSSVVSIIGTLKGARATQDAANYNAQVNLNNANAARLTAKENARRQKRLGLKRQGGLRALDPDKLDLLEDSAIEEELQVSTLLHAGEVKAIGSENTARLDIAKGMAARQSGYIGATGTLLTGTSDLVESGVLGGLTSTTSAGMSGNISNYYPDLATGYSSPTSYYGQNI
tara:strand:+ start:96 stop:656 length:561 start_codon:yes stop_codon:yes gene_type:complete